MTEPSLTPEAAEEEPARRQPDRPLAKVVTQLLGVGLIILGVFLLYVMVSIWPTVQRITAGGSGVATTTTTTVAPGTTRTTASGQARPTPTTQATAGAGGSGQGTGAADGSTATITLLGVRLSNIDPDTALLLLVVTASALGSYVHAATSFATYVGNRRFTLSWTWWYLLRVFIGAALAVLFYFVVRGGLLSAQAQSGAVNPYGIAGLAALVGLFSKQATDKLREVFETLFRTQAGTGDDERKDKLTYPTPRIIEVEPRPVPPGAPIRLRLEGTGFTAESKVRVRRLGKDPQEVVPAAIDFVSATEMAVSLEAKDLPPTTELEFVVVNPEPGGGESEPLRVAVADLPDSDAAPAKASWRRPWGRR
jgi:hypothetical protein